MHAQMDPVPSDAQLDYSTRQDMRNRQYEHDCAKHGIESKPERYVTGAIEFDPNRESASYTPDLAGSLDDEIDRLIEKHGHQNARLIIAIVTDLKKPMEREIEMNRALLLGRTLAQLIKCPTSNLRASAHQLMHAIPRMAGANGIKSMRESARICGVSVEWIRKGRNHWCEILSLPIPAESAKSDEACKQYANNALGNHWRNQKVTKPNPILCPPKQHRNLSPS